MLCRAAKVGGTSLRPAIPARISSTKRGRITNCATTFNTVEKIQTDPRFQKFLRWLYKQQEGTFFRTRRNRKRTSQPYR